MWGHLWKPVWGIALTMLLPQPPLRAGITGTYHNLAKASINHEEKILL